jgi:hypothetical protein
MIRKSTKIKKRTIVRKKKIRKIKRIKLPPIKKLRKELIKVHSIYIRTRDKHKCYTCGLQMTRKESQNGHYISRSKLMFDDVNCHCQCFRCNVRLKGNYTEYALRLTRDYGLNVLEILKAKSLEIKPYNRNWYNEMLLHYKKKLFKMGVELW